jgi:hypothetical protein
MANEGGVFKFKIGQRVMDTRSGQQVRIVKRTIEPALGKTYLIRHQDKRLGGYTPERFLEAEKKQ